MLWRVNYATDAGKIYAYVSLRTSNLFLLLPAVFMSNAVRGTGFCSLPRNLEPRKAILWDVEGKEHKIEYPFQPASVEWSEFWMEIAANPLIISYKGIGEIRGIK